MRNFLFKLKKFYYARKYDIKCLITHTVKIAYIALVFGLTFKGVDIVCSLL